jgi:hypothetical protein
MGIYINPIGQDKGDWLIANMDEYFDRLPNFDTVPDDSVLVCLVNNGPFTAAGVIVDDYEYRAMSQPSDVRPKGWFFVKRDKVAAVCPDYARWLKNHGY